MQLDIATTDELVDELKRRFRSLLLITDNPKMGIDDNEMSTITYWSNCPTVNAVGLARWAETRCLESDEDGS
jgi:hypothetical protein